MGRISFDLPRANSAAPAPTLCGRTAPGRAPLIVSYEQARLKQARLKQACLKRARLTLLEVTLEEVLNVEVMLGGLGGVWVHIVLGVRLALVDDKLNWAPRLEHLFLDADRIAQE